MFRRFLRLRNRDRAQLRDRRNHPPGPLPDPPMPSSPSDPLPDPAQPGHADDTTQAAWRAAAPGAQVQRLNVFPIKSLDGVQVERAAVTAAGALAGDREFALRDAQGEIVTAKRSQAIHLIRARFDLGERTVVLARSATEPGLQADQFHLDRDRPALVAWLSEALGQPVTLHQDAESGFPDDPKAWGPTIVSTATLETVAGWFGEGGLAIEDLRRRLRTNLELGGVPAFWEDGLFGPPGAPRAFGCGGVKAWAVNPCQRCPVPTRDPDTGQPYPGFQKIFTDHRRDSLPGWVDRTWFNHFYRLTVNTRLERVAEGTAERVLAVGDRLSFPNSPAELAKDFA